MSIATVIVRIGIDNEQIKKAAMRGLKAQAMILKGRSQAICPIDTGTLRNSCVIEEQENSIIVGYGGAASSYALIQHENLQFAHSSGKQAKYLEQPFDEMQDEIADAVEEAVLGAFR